MEIPPFMVFMYCPTKTSIHNGVFIATFSYQRVNHYYKNYKWHTNSKL